MKHYWISWEQPGDDHRPISFPPNEKVLGWWCSGYTGDGERATLVAMVEASSEDAAKAALADDWPETLDCTWRFAEESDGKPPGDRFPLVAWMVPRFNAEEDK